MPASLFSMGFRSGGFQALPMNLGLSLKDLQQDWKDLYSQVKDVRSGLPTTVPPGTVPLKPPVVAPSTIMGVDSTTFMVGTAVVLGGGILAAVLLSNKK